MTISMDQFDQMIQELTTEGTTEGRKSVILSELRNDYTTGVEQSKEVAKQVESLKAEKQLLSETNIRLYQAGNSFSNKPKEKTFSEKITLESIEQKLRKF